MLIKKTILLSLIFHALAVCCLFLAARSMEYKSEILIGEFNTPVIFLGMEKTHDFLQEGKGAGRNSYATAASGSKAGKGISPDVTPQPHIADRDNNEISSLSKEKSAGVEMQKPDPASLSGMEEARKTGQQGTGLSVTDSVKIRGYSLTSVQGSANSEQNIRAHIRASIERIITYPALARIRRHEGTVFVEFSINATGHPDNIRITNSSGSELLDASARNSIINAAPFPVLPGNIEMPVTFRLKQ